MGGTYNVSTLFCPLETLYFPHMNCKLSRYIQVYVFIFFLFERVQLDYSIHCILKNDTNFFFMVGLCKVAANQPISELIHSSCPTDTNLNKVFFAWQNTNFAMQKLHYLNLYQ